MHHQEMCLRALVLFLVTWAAAAAPNPRNASLTQPNFPKGSGSSLVFPVHGNVYPMGYYYAKINIGNPPNPYFLDIDTGSDLTWLQCDFPCTSCYEAPHPPYKPNRNSVFLSPEDPICSRLLRPGSHSQDRMCPYKVEYADHFSSKGVMVRDQFSLESESGRNVKKQLAFGCGYHQEFPYSAPIPKSDGVLGLGVGNPSILAQLHNMGVTRNVLAHCFRRRGGGFLFLGDDFHRDKHIVWKSISTQSGYYSLGEADVKYGGRATKITGLPIVFDSGSTYTYFNSQAHSALVSSIKRSIDKNELRDVPESEDQTLHVCWKGRRPFKSIGDAASHFKPLSLSFSTNAGDVQFPLPPECYLVVTGLGHVCLGILDAERDHVELPNINVIGEISMQDKLVIFDNEKRRVGWKIVPDCRDIS